MKAKLVPALAILTVACTQNASAPDAPDPTQEAGAPTAADAAGPESFGAPVSEAGAALSLATIMEKPEEFASKTVRVAGEVRTVCQKKGCWMELASSDAKDGPGARVTFKDYGFFVPKDCAGSRALIEGTIEVKTLPADEVAHLEGEGAKVAAKAADGSAKEIRIVADGVKLWKS